MSFLKRFIKQNSKSEKVKEEDKDRLYFHEDFYCQVELLPRENFSELEKENEKIEDFAQRHSDGFGFTDIYVRNGHKIRTSDRKIKLGDFEKVMLESGFQKHPNVYSGYSSYEERCKNTLGFELDSSVVYCDFENDLIKNIWIDNFRFSNSSDKKEQLINGLFSIGDKWDLTETFDLMNKGEIERYISVE
jgi:hypothetical protein